MSFLQGTSGEHSCFCRESKAEAGWGLCWFPLYQPAPQGAHAAPGKSHCCQG